RKLTTDNKCSIDFDPYGFTIRDYHTRQTLLRCDSTGDLYPLRVAASAFALLINNHFLWHQRLGHPGDTSKLLHFRVFIKTQFNREIKAFQCDHGEEFDNSSLHELFATNGIQFRFSCPRPSQQNGKSERMIFSINNIVRSLLFQACLPPEYSVEALLTAAYLLNIPPPPPSTMTSLTQNYLTNQPLTPTFARLDAFVTLTPFHRTNLPLVPHHLSFSETVTPSLAAENIILRNVGVGLESKVMRECCFVVERDAWLRGEFTLSSLDVFQGFNFFLQMGLTLILATFDGLDVGLLGDVIGEDDCDDDGLECIYSGGKV
nr:ribonuclease H-like domain-containing protein [Tanacetum cinerariifolium]